MNEIIKVWLRTLYTEEIEEAKSTIDNETIWELGYDGEEPNPHTENIKLLKEYIDILEEKIKELFDDDIKEKE